MGLDPAEPGLRSAGVPPPERSAGGGGHPAATRFARRGSTRVHQTDPWNYSAGEDPLPEPFRTELPERPGARGRRCCSLTGSRGETGRGFAVNKTHATIRSQAGGETSMTEAILYHLEG